MAKIDDPEVQRGLAKRKKSKTKVNPEEEFAKMLSTARIPFDREYKFHPDRKWRSDFFLRHNNILVEVNGGTHLHMGHSTHSGITRDYEKTNAAVVLGYRPLSFTTDHVMSGYAIEMVLLAIGVGANKNDKKKGRR